jgi:hypothetical protein
MGMSALLIRGYAALDAFHPLVRAFSCFGTGLALRPEYPLVQVFAIAGWQQFSFDQFKRSFSVSPPSSPSVDTSKPAIRGRGKTGHRADAQASEL